MNARAEFQRLMAIDKAAHQMALTAKLSIEQLPETFANFSMVLEALIARIQEAQGSDYSEVLEFLGDAHIALTEVRAFSDEDLRDFCRERMEGGRV